MKIQNKMVSNINKWKISFMMNIGEMEMDMNMNKVQSNYY